ncbi:MAG TPA: SRPBCC domain-containing protein [Bacteroidota bacterium]|nr:SRPBCC domain-containing protein [Bacteroidota bacterium]
MAPIREIVFERILDASPEVVWQAWTVPGRLKQWWGPDNVSIPECEIELRVGGKIYIVMEAGEAMGPYKGTRWPMEGKLTVVEKNSKLSFTVRAWTEGQEQATQIEQGTELRLVDENGRTKLHLKAVVYKTGPKAEMAVKGMEAGFNQQLNKLDKFLTQK